MALNTGYVQPSFVNDHQLIHASQRNPGPFVQFHGIDGAKGRFLGFYSVLINAAYAFIGTEILGMTAAEMSNPRKNIPRAIKGVYVRILVFYILGVFVSIQPGFPRALF